MKRKILVLVGIITIVMTAFSIGVYAASDIKLLINGKQINSEIQIIDGSSYVPLRVVSESLGAEVKWDEGRRIITINSSGSSPTTSDSSSEQTKIKAPLTIHSSDGKTYLGKLTADEYDTDSIFNEFGTYGSKYETDSIMNEYGKYGSKYENTSAFNNYATKPPIILDGDGSIVGYLTTNTSIDGGISPIGIKKFLEDNGY